MDEKSLGHGVVRRNPLLKRIQKLWRQANGQKIGKSSVQFNWAVGYDVRDTIGSIQIKNQGSSSSCGGQAGAYFLEIQERLRNIKEGAISAKSIYSPWQNLGGGMTVTQLNVQIGAHGANLEATVPSYDAYGNPLTELMMNDQSWKIPAIIKDAGTRAGYTPYDIAEDIETVAQTIQNYGAVFFEIRGQDGNTPSWLSMTPALPSKLNANEFWFHYMCCFAAKLVNGQKKIVALQSWGRAVIRNGVTYIIGDINDPGVQHFGEEWFTSGNIIDAFTFIHDSQVVPVQTKYPTIWQALAIWFRQQWGLANYLSA